MIEPVTNVTALSSPTPPAAEIPENETACSDYSGPHLKDKNGVALNPIPKEYLRGVTRLFEIKSVWCRAGDRSRYELIEYLFPAGWDKMIRDNMAPAAHFEQMKLVYEKKEIELEASELELMVEVGKLWWWWVYS